MPRYRIIGKGRAGLSLDRALQSVGWDSRGTIGSGQSVAEAGADVELLVLAVPDDVISEVAFSVLPDQAVVAHMAGSRTLAELKPHRDVASIHPLMSLPDPEIGAKRLLDNCTFAVAGDPIVWDLVSALGGTAIAVADSDRAAYHAGAAVAGNHGVALWAQIERIASSVNIPATAYWQLMRTSLENAVRSTAAEAITGPAARGDWDTCRSHLAAIDPAETTLYVALAREVATVAGRTFPEDLV